MATIWQKTKKYIRLGIRFKTLSPRRQEALRQRNKYIRGKRNFIKSKGKCNYCGSTKNLTIDHIIPISKLPKGIGYKLKSNWQVLCSKCNGKKGNKILIHR